MRRWGGEAWERQQGEPVKAWHAFRVFRDLGAERSIDKTAEDTAVTYRPSTLRDWAKRWNWTERAAAHDGHLDRRRLKAAGEAIEKMTARQIERAVKLQDVGGKFFDAVVKKVDEDPDSILKHLTAHTALRAIELGVDVERRARGAETAAAEAAAPAVLAAGVKVNLFVRIDAVAANMAAAQAIQEGLVVNTTLHQSGEEEEATG